jgi:hypothetical protein
VLAAVTGIALHSLVDFPLRIAAVAVAFLVVCVAAGPASSTRVQPRDDGRDESGSSAPVSPTPDAA